jgi:hypothetical protein
MRAWQRAGLTILTLLASGSARGAESEAAPTPDRPLFHLFLLMGQSNMSGYGELQPGDEQPVPGVLKIPTVAKGDFAWQPAAHPLHNRLPSDRFGLGLPFAIEYRKAHPGVTVGLIPVGFGGAGIDSLKKGSAVYADAIAKAKWAAQGGVLKGVLWHQGESDTVAPASADAYAAKLDGLVRDLRGDLESPELPFVCGELADFYGTGRDHKAPDRVARIAQVQQALAELPQRVPHTACVSGKGLHSIDGHLVHFDRASYIELGRRYAVALAAVGKAAGPSITIGDPAAAAGLPYALNAAYAGGARDITIAPGTYVLPATGRSAITLVGWKDVHIRARGVTLVFEDLAHRPVSLQRCEGITIEGAELRFARPAFTQGRIVALGHDDRGNYLDWELSAGYPTNFNPVQAMIDVADAQTCRIKPGTGDVGFHEVEARGERILRLRKRHGRLGSAAVGDWLFTRVQPCEPIVHLDGCARCTMRDVTLQNAGFAAFFETGGAGGHVYVGCKVMPGPRPAGATEDQLVGCGADGFHSSGVRVGPTLERCVWEGLLHDDCIAIHGSLQQVEQVEAERLILEKGNRGGFVVGEPVRISSTNGFFGEFACTAMRTLADGRQELTLDRPSGAPAGAKASNPRHNGAGFRILNCTLGQTRSRGILVKADHGLIEGNTIRGCGMSAISIGPEYYWNEADYVRHVTVRGNTLAENVLNGGAAGTLFVHGDGAIGNADLMIADNFFDQNYGQTAVYIAFTDGARIVSNRFVASPLPLPDQARTVIHIESSRNIALAGNTVERPAAADRLVSLGAKVEAITGHDAAGIRVVP